MSKCDIKTEAGAEKKLTEKMKTISDIMDSVEKADADAAERAAQRQDKLAKPPGSLGGLEDISVKMAGITGEINNSIKKTCVIVMCADNGVVQEGVASAPQSVTMAQTVNFTRRLTGVGALSESFGSDLLIVDLGVKDEIPAVFYDTEPLRDTHKIVNRRLRPGTDNIAEGPAMTADEAVQCFLTGIEMADAAKAADFDIIGIGEMGIGNTTTSAAVLSALLGLDSSETCGRGGGVADRGFMRKKEIVDEAARRCRKKLPEGFGAGMADTGKKKEAREYVLRVLAEVGGFDICAMAGAFIGAARNRMPVVIDGFISVVAALAAYMMVPASADYMFASHKSWENGYSRAVEALGLKPFLELDMRLGEGSGCPIAFEVIRGACDVMNNMATFEEAEINDGYLEEVRKGGCF